MLEKYLDFFHPDATNLIGKLIGALAGDQGLMTETISWLILIIFAFSILSLGSGLGKLKSCLQFTLDQLAKEDISRNWASSNENFQKLNRLFLHSNCKPLEHQWREFAESVVEEDDSAGEGVGVFVNTEPASNFINFNSIVVQYDGWWRKTSFSYFESVPTVLTGLGILGTFVGIIQALPESMDFENQLPAFLGGMKGAFVTSILGLCLSIIFTAYERYNLSRLEKRITKLSSQLDFVFRRKTQQDFLLKIEEYSRKQYDATRKLALEIGQEVVRGITGGGISTVDISDSVRESIGSGFEKLGDVLGGLATAHDQFVSTTTIIDEKFRGIGLSVANLNRSAEICSQTLEIGARGFQESAGALTRVGGELTSVASETTKVVSEQKQAGESLNQAWQGMDRTVEALIQSNKDFLNGYTQVFEDFAKNVEYFNNANTSSLEKNLKAFDLELGGGLNKWKGNIDGLKVLLEDMQPTIENFQANIKALNEILESNKVSGGHESAS